MPSTIKQFAPGQRVVVTQQIPQRDEVWTIQTRGEVVRAGQGKTGSWYAHAKDNRFWLDRLQIRKDDGELVTFNLDRYTHVEVDARDAAAAPESAAAAEARAGASAAAGAGG